MPQLGRISGPLLAENLLRNGANLTFSNDRTVPASVLLHLDVVNQRVGIRTSVPTSDFLINNTVGTPNIIADSGVISDFDITQGQIQNLIGDINIVAADTVIVPHLRTQDIDINGNTISTYTENTDLVLQADHSQLVSILDNTVFDQDLTIAGNAFLQALNASNLQFENVTVAGALTVDNTAEFENIRIDQNNISTTISDSSIDIRPDGIGTLEAFASTNIDQSLTVTDNLDVEGSTTLGSNNADSVTFNSQIDSDVVPSQNSVYNLGSPQRQWSEIKSQLLNGIDIETAIITVGTVQLGDPQGNIFYVAANGDNSNRGDHQQGPWASLRFALEQAEASAAAPTTIFVYPGVYEEQLPLRVPSNVTVKGADIRNTVIKPDSASQSEDVFLLEGETTVQDLTVKDFFYDSVNDKGYAFRFANSAGTKALISSRSPYIQNVSVITFGSSTTPQDPRGFHAGDAGRGALIDGADVDPASIDASMLFHSCTFITPNADAVVMRNGVRVEWLNGFTYFANIGLLAENGDTGRLTNDGSTVRKGAEIRSIGSANIYGNFGAVADGDETLMYLINHNFAYTGTGKDASNDLTLTISGNETVELNSGKIYFTSTNARGNFQVGDEFFVDFETGKTTLGGDGVDITGITSLRIDSGGSNVTFINAERIQTGRLIFSGNTVSSITGPINFQGATTTTNINSSLDIDNDLSIVGNLTLSGDLLTLGDEITDTVELGAKVTSNVVPETTGAFNLGSATKQWNTVFVNQAEIDDIQITNNYITTTVSNSNLELRANALGSILVPNNDVEITNNLTVSGTTSLVDFVSESLSLTGNFYITGDFLQNGNISISGNLQSDRTAVFENTQIQGNVITTIDSNSDLELRANGSGRIYLPDNDLEVDNNVTVNDVFTAESVEISNSLAANKFQISNNIEIHGNVVTTTQSNSDLELRAEGNATVKATSSNVEISNELAVIGGTFLQNLEIVGNTAVVGDVNQQGNQTITGSVSASQQLTTGADAVFELVEFSGNTVRTKSGNTDLQLAAAGTGSVLFVDSAEITQNLLVSGLTTLNNVTVSSTAQSNMFTTGDILIQDNFITTTQSNSNLELRAEGLGNILLQDIRAKNNIISTASTDLVLASQTDTVIDSNASLVLPVGTTAQSTATNGDLRFNISINRFQGYAGGGRAVLNGVFSDDLTTNVRVNDTDNILRFTVNNTEVGTIVDGLDFHRLQVDSISINNNELRSSSDLVFETSGTGGLVTDNIRLEGNTVFNTQPGELSLKSSGQGYYKLAGSGGFVITADDTASRRSNPEQGEVRWNTELEIAEVYDGVEWIIATGTATAISESDYNDLLLEFTLVFG